jgi:uncharacterized membrane protein YtjA (UPF0391 family)
MLLLIVLLLLAVVTGALSFSGIVTVAALAMLMKILFIVFVLSFCIALIRMIMAPATERIDIRKDVRRER